MLGYVNGAVFDQKTSGVKQGEMMAACWQQEEKINSWRHKKVDPAVEVTEDRERGTVFQQWKR